MNIKSREFNCYWPSGSDLHILKAAYHPDISIAIACWGKWSCVQNLDTASWNQVQLAAIAATRLPKEVIGNLLPRLEGVRRSVWTQGSVRLHKVGAFLRKLAAAGITPLLLKGGARISENRSALAERSFADIDVLIYSADWNAVTNIIFDSGYKNIWELSRDDVQYRLRNTHHSMAIRVADGMEVDLHQSSLLLNRQKGMDDGLWARSIHGTLEKAPVRLPHPSDLLAITLGHAFLYTEQPNLGWVGDALACVSADKFDWRLFEAVVSERELQVSACVGLSFLKTELSVEVPDEIIKNLNERLCEPFISEFEAFRLQSSILETTFQPELLLEAELIRALKSFEIPAVSENSGNELEEGYAKKISLNTFMIPVPRTACSEVKLVLKVKVSKRTLPIYIAVRSFDYLPIEFARRVVTTGASPFQIGKITTSLSISVSNAILKAREIPFLKVVVWLAANNSQLSSDPELGCNISYCWTL